MLNRLSVSDFKEVKLERDKEIEENRWRTLKK